jgi:outer membrane protein TolC
MQLSDLTTQLNDVLGLPLDTKLVLDPVIDFGAEVPTRETALQTALKNNPEVQQAITELYKARAAQGAAKAEYIPDITGFARYSYQNGVSFVDHNFGTFGIHFNYDLFDGGKRESLVRERNEETSEAQENIERVKEEVGVRIAKVYDRLATTRSMVDVAKGSLAAFEENSRLVDDQFRQGKVLPSSVDASRAQTLEAEAGVLTAQLEYLLAQDELTRILGRTGP